MKTLIAAVLMSLMLSACGEDPKAKREKELMIEVASEVQDDLTSGDVLEGILITFKASADDMTFDQAKAKLKEDEEKNSAKGREEAALREDPN